MPLLYKSVLDAHPSPRPISGTYNLYVLSTDSKIYLQTDSEEIDLTIGAGAIAAALFDANTILKADSDDTPVALTIAEQTLVGRITSGVITALTATQVRTLLNVADGADVTGDNPPQAHASSHQDGGSDEISVAGLSGVLADAQTPASHASSHENGGGDEISVAGLSGVLADAQTPSSHASSHENGGGDEINVAGLSGVLADAQTPSSHASSHENGGSDEISVAGLSGLLADAQTPSTHASTHQSGGADAIKLDDLAAPDDNTDLDASTSAHGLMQKYPGGTTTFLRADGSFAVPSGAVDEKVKVSSDDTTAGYVEDKIIGTSNKIVLSTNNGGANENRQITTGSDIVDLAVASQITGTTEKTVPVDNDEVLIEDSADSNAKKSVKIGNFAFPSGHIDGFTITRTSTTQLTISSGEARDSADVYNIVKGTSTVVNITTSGANGLDTGSEASSTCYHIFVCVGSSGVCGLISTSLTPTLPSGYTNGYRQVGSWYNASDGDWAQGLQMGSGRIRSFTYNEPRNNELRVLDSGSASSWTNIDISDLVPLNCTWVQVLTWTVDADGYGRLRPDGFTGQTGGVLEDYAGNYNSGGGWLMNVNRTIEYEVDGGASYSVFVVAYQEEV